jgi:hydroxymethylglutaryl-CoA reductase (NADPH)
MKFEESETIIPTSTVGPIKINYEGRGEQCRVPLATFETPLRDSTKRGALVSQTASDGINLHVIDDVMTRSVILEAESLRDALQCQSRIKDNEKNIADAVRKTGKFAILKSISAENVGRLLYIRIGIETGNASGHNMVTQAADAVINLILSECKNMKYVSVSGNYCVDKKVSAINGILGRGKRASAELIVSRDICRKILKTTPEKIIDLNVKKNLIGSTLAGGVRSANSHYANIALAVYLATGQDAANIIEASQGITFADMSGDDLYFSVNLPNIIVGTVGNGKNLPFAIKNLMQMGCFPEDPNSAKRLAALTAAAVLCSELSLMAALTNPGELMQSHLRLERGKIDCDVFRH